VSLSISVRSVLIERARERERAGEFEYSRMDQCRQGVSSRLTCIRELCVCVWMGGWVEEWVWVDGRVCARACENTMQVRHTRACV